MCETSGSFPYQDVAVTEALDLVRNDEVRVLDVRTPAEYENLGHIPASTLVPMNLLPVALAMLAQEDKPFLICCEHGIRSVAAAEFLAHSGCGKILNLVGGMSVWTGPREFTPGTPFGPHGPSSWLIQNADLLPEKGAILDVACGRGRHALLLAAAQFDVLAVDNKAEVIETLRLTAKNAEIPLRTEVVDLEVAGVNLRTDEFDVVLVVHYLFRPLFPTLIRALRPGGILLYETFTVDQAAHGRKPSNPAFLLKPGELLELVRPLEVVRQREGEFEDRCVASVVARKLDLSINE